MDVQYDIIVLGSGPGGYVAAIRSAQLGFKTAIVEKENLGGICLNWGCIPTKALLKSAEVLQQLLHAQEYGISAKDISADFESIIKRSRTVAEGMNKGIQFLMQKNKIDIVKGYGKVKPGRRIEVTSEDGIILDYKAKHIIIATGSSPRSLQNLPFDNKYVIDYRKAMTLEQLPSSLIVVGAGAIGVEFAYFYRSLGVEVTLVELSNRILPAEDEDISSALTKIFKRNGINILTTSRILANKIENDKCKVVLSTPNGEEVILADKILSATGVVANINNIGLEYTGIEVEKGKIKTDAFYRTNIEGFYAIGDIVQGPALAHVASAEGITCVESIAGHHPPMIQYDNIPGCIYCSPEIASVGITETKAREKGLDILVGKFPFSASGKAKSSGHSEGFVKIIFDKKYGEILGAHFIGDHVTEMIAEIVVAKNIEATGLQLLKSIHPHPTMSEAILEATAIAYGEGIHI
jgi:dihydrolipoamide dehydrogenase